MPRRPVLAAAVALAALVIAATACAPEENEPQAADDWSQQYCAMLANWVSAAKSADETFASGDEKLRADLEEAMASVDIATETLSDGLGLLGPPETPSGAEVEQRVDELGSDISARFHRADQALDESADEPPFPFFEAMGTVGTEMVAAVADIVRTNVEIRRLDPELGKELDDSAACADLQEELT